jgi:flagellar assembly protein FliH
MSVDSIPKEKQTAYERWELSSLADPADPMQKPERRVRENDHAAVARISEMTDEIRKEAYSKGYTKGMQDGFAVGLDKGREFAEAEREKLRTLTVSFDQALEHADEQIADDVLALALDVAKAMLKSKISVDETVILPVVKDAIHYLPHIEKPARIIVHPDDAGILRTHLADELASDAWVIQEELSIERGGCLVETGANKIDATNNVRWKRITEAFSKHVDW